MKDSDIVTTLQNAWSGARIPTGTTDVYLSQSAHTSN